MPTDLEWYDILFRLALTVAGGATLGIDRTERSRPAGLRTVLLVSLAASLAMILVNRLIMTTGKPADSFVQLDMMRLPLGILTGVGFIGAGAIVHRQDLVLGVTTAATLWFASVVGLCFGAGQAALGIVGVVLGILVLSGLRHAESFLPQDHRATVTLVLDPAAGAADAEVARSLAASGYASRLLSVNYGEGGRRREFCWDIGWTGQARDVRLPPFLAELAQHPGVVQLSWQPSFANGPPQA